MLPAWATVVISIVSALAGVAGGVVAVRIRIGFDRSENAISREHERSERWVDRFVRAADDFSTGIEQAILGVRDVIHAVNDGGDVDSARVEAKRRLDEAIARIARIKLLFGEDSDAARVARDILPELDVARGLAERPNGGAWEKLATVYALHREFNAVAFQAISSPKPPPST
jgi:hypothetical protein